MMIECEENTVAPFDSRVLDSLKNSTHDALNFPEDYQSILPLIAGRCPKKQYFALGGDFFRVAWFVSFLDNHSELPPPKQPACLYTTLDSRVEDKSLPALINSSHDVFFSGEELLPIAALYTENLTDEFMPISLRYHAAWSDLPVNDALCYRRSSPWAIVHCDGKKLTDEFNRIENGYEKSDADLEEFKPDYDSCTTFVANSFAQFCELLQAHPDIAT